MTCAPRKQSKTYKVPKRPYEAARLDAELKVGHALCGLWREAELVMDLWDVLDHRLAQRIGLENGLQPRTQTGDGTRRPDSRPTLLFLPYANGLWNLANIQLAGEYGLRNKREIWRIQLTLSKVSLPFAMGVKSAQLTTRSDVLPESSLSSRTRTPSDSSRVTP